MGAAPGAGNRRGAGPLALAPWQTGAMAGFDPAAPRPRSRAGCPSTDKRRLSTALARYGFNPVVRALFRVGLPAPGTAILETLGRRSGQPRRTPVTDGLDGDVFWLVAEHGRRAGYVRNLQATPRVRVKVGRRWRAGTAHVLPDDDPRRRLAAIARARPLARFSLAAVRLMQTDLLTVRIDLDPAQRSS
jgi:deazaflavin-dependent oxidoreductase (nitroreductase family)